MLWKYCPFDVKVVNMLTIKNIIEIACFFKRVSNLSLFFHVISYVVVNQSIN